MSSKLFVEEEKERVVIEVDGDDDDEQKISLVPIHSHGSASQRSESRIAGLSTGQQTSSLLPSRNFPPPARCIDLTSASSPLSRDPSLSMLQDGRHRAAGDARSSTTNLVSEAQASSVTPLQIALQTSDSIEDEKQTDPNDAMDDEDFDIWMAQTHGGEFWQSSLAPGRKSTITFSRNPPITDPLHELDRYLYKGVNIKKNRFIELIDGDFMQVKHIVRHRSTSMVTLRGFLFRRTKFMNNLFENFKNEVCLIQHVDEDDPRHPNVQAMETKPVTDVVKRRGIRLTNRPFPDLSYRNINPQINNDLILHSCVLVCRYKYICYYPSAEARKANVFSEQGLHRLREADCDESMVNEMQHQKDDDLHKKWRGLTHRGGDHQGSLEGEEEFLDQEWHSHSGQYVCQPLTMPNGRDHSARDAMKRGEVGTVLDEDGLPQKTEPIDEEETQNRHQVRRQRSPPSLFDALSQSSRLSVNNGAKQTLRRSSAGDIVNETTAPEVIEIDAIFNRSTSSGTLNQRFEGRLTTKFSPNLFSNAKRSADKTSDFDTRPRKKSHTGCSPGVDGSFNSTSNVDVIDLTDSCAPTIFPVDTVAKGKTSLRAEPGSRSQAPVSMGDTRSPTKLAKQRYTFGDCFCGAGGMSRGAISAGLRVKWGFDRELHACRSYALNFFGTPVYNVSADRFARKDGDYQVDVCHLSPPCQYFSPAHTTPGKNDESNTATLFAADYLLEATKPRIGTVEETSGLLNDVRHHMYFKALIRIFTSKGFSLRWKLINCADFGLPQSRKRLFIIASCPGEPLPPFPKPTHSKKPTKTGLKPWTTINQAISSIPTGWPNHDPEACNYRIPHAVSDGNQIAKCITTSGGQGNEHPSGTRGYTLREIMCLQGFPLGHKFGEVGVKTQTGNAVPPNVATIFLEEIRRALERADGLA